MEARSTALGYVQRGGTPTAFDRVLSTKYGAKAMELAMEGKFNVLTVIKNGKLDSCIFRRCCWTKQRNWSCFR